MIEYRIATADDIELLMSSRLEMLKVVNNLTDDYVFPDLIVNESRDYFLNGDQTTVIAIDGAEVIGCASMSYMRIMPTFSHPTGKRAHLMNVYTRNEYRRQGIARKMVLMLIEDAWNRGSTEISLDATTMGRPLYESLGFKTSSECMVLTKD
ncbi:GNAT family N-acetyltransferase [Butyrivibrio sp. AE2032]|uniref:GNAT family N-acetyltransferase n=1 Tax=Butyrivibrio sp. AE2032 TaxID=1458463 RepID=UPI00055700FD|nr:GNAT family N-acetyltransferase [Butyrivibrio sp. AE2032]